jgi:hypothetical protein
MRRGGGRGVDNEALVITSAAPDNPTNVAYFPIPTIRHVAGVRRQPV